MERFSEVFKRLKSHIAQLKTDIENKTANPSYEYVVNNMTVFKNYLDAAEELKTCKQKARKQLQRIVEDIETGSKQFKSQLEQYKSILVLKEEIRQNEEYIETLKQHFQNSFNRVVQFLEHFDYIKERLENEEPGKIWRI